MNSVLPTTESERRRVTVPIPSLAWRFWSNVPIGNPDDCWLWSGGRNGQGYPVISEGRRSFVATRLMRGFIDGASVPSSAVVCHSCDNPPCVNPLHLWVGSKRDNARDMVAKGRRGGRALMARCFRGHEFTPENTMFERGARRCRICRSQRNRIPANRIQETA